MKSTTSVARCALNQTVQVCGDGNFFTEFTPNATTGKLECAANKTCQTYESAYGSSTGMCNKIFGTTFKTSTNEGTCVDLWPDAAPDAAPLAEASLPLAAVALALVALLLQ
jgi:hypothetical protein